jgi:hypothetical protein
MRNKQCNKTAAYFQAAVLLWLRRVCGMEGNQAVYYEAIWLNVTYML